MALKQLYGDRDLNGDVLKNYSFTTFADLAAANLVVGSVFGFAFMVNPGSLYYNQTGLTWQPVGGKGSKGDAGVPGNSVLSGSGAPINGPAGTGVDGDFYIDTAGIAIYGPKTAGVWGAPTSFVGTPGSPGSPGANGNTVLNGVAPPTGINGVNGDFFLNTVSMNMYGPKAGGVWPSGTSLIGPPGVQGEPGTAGPTGPVGPSGQDASTVSYISQGNVAPATLTQSAAGTPTAVPTGGVRFDINTTDNTFYLWTVPAWSTSTIPKGVSRYNGAYLYYTSSGGVATVAPTHTTMGQTITGADGVDWTVIETDIGWDPITAAFYLRTGTYDMYALTAGGWVVTQNLAAGTNLVSTPTSGPTTLTRYRNQTVLYDTTSGAFSVALPIAPVEGDVVRFKNKTISTNVLTITGTVDGTVDPTCNLARQLYVVEYLSSAWRKMN